jgi:curved DNA-binding protein CbpA
LLVAAVRVPKLVSGVGDVRSLPLAPVDGFILSRVDGSANVRQIAATTGLAEDVVDGSLAKLRSLGIVEFPGEPPPEPPPPPPSAPPQAARLPPDAPMQIPPEYDVRELDEDCDLEMPQRHRVLDLYHRLDDVDFYALLGVARDADKKAIKRAYFQLAAHFHPDKFFRKNLGSFKQKMEIIFGRVTEAHDTLVDKERRPEYDEYLSLQATTRGIEEVLAGAQAELERAQAELVRASTDGQDSQAPDHRTSSVPASRPRAISSPEISSSYVPSPTDPRELRDALARRLRGTSPTGRPAAARSGPPPTMSYASTQDAMDALKRRYDDRRVEAQRIQAKKYRDVGDLARAKNDMVSAANAYRVAASLAPDDEPLQKLAQATAEAAENVLVDTYQKQAVYEERTGRWADAVRSWKRVARNKQTDAKVWDRLAHAILESGGNLHEAVDASKKAIEYGSAIIGYRLTLIEIYLAAGLTIAAKRDLEAAIRMEPNSPAVQALLKRLQKV